MSSIVHLSDLHLGASPQAAHALSAAVEEVPADALVVVTGDLTDGGRRSELAHFEALVAPVAERLIMVPGNHDRCGDDVGASLMGGARVDAQVRGGCAVIRVDSTAPHNRIAWLSHGRLCELVLRQVDDTLAALPTGLTTIVALHHHVVPLPAEGFWERVSEVLHLPNHSELTLGAEFLKVLRGRCDLVLHGHRHVPRQFVVAPDSARPLRVFNAGSTTALGAFRQFELHEGQLAGEGRWVQFRPAPRPSPHMAPQPLARLQLA
jgi:3',5'-cyclic AMP phosphodiesterase CpdA